MNVIDRVNDLCNKHKLSKYRLSLLTGISQSAFSKMEKQQSTLSLDTIQRICDAFGISLAQFFSDEDDYPDLSLQQRTLLESWSRLSQPKKEFIQKMIIELCNMEEN